MMFQAVAPAPDLAALVVSYWFIKDIRGDFDGRVIRTSPIPMTVLSVNLGRPNAADDGTLVPRASLLGLQSRSRSWRSWSDTNFVMAMLTVRGVVRLFPHTGAGTVRKIVDLGAIIGDSGADALARGIGADLKPDRIAGLLDNWLIERLKSSTSVPEYGRLAAVHDILKNGGSVTKAAEAASIDRRQIQRWFQRHLGVGPKELADLERLQKSLRSVQGMQGNAVAGFSDQAHQIRSWRRRLGLTPTAYGKKERSPMATFFGSNKNEPGPAFYL